MKKRLKSFAITFTSLFITVFASVALSPEWKTFLAYANSKLTEMGLSPVVVALMGVIVSEVWKQVLNNRTIEKAKRTGGARLGGSFADYNNEMY